MVLTVKSRTFVVNAESRYLTYILSAIIFAVAHKNSEFISGIVTESTKQEIEARMQINLAKIYNYETGLEILKYLERRGNRCPGQIATPPRKPKLQASSIPHGLSHSQPKHSPTRPRPRPWHRSHRRNWTPWTPFWKRPHRSRHRQ